MQLIYTFFSVIAIGLMAPAICSRLIFLAPTRLGAINYFANVFSDIFLKRFDLARGATELGLFIVGAVMLLLVDTSTWIGVMIAAAVLAGLEIIVRWQERRILDAVYAHQDGRWVKVKRTPNAPIIPGVHPHPSFHPELTVNLNGPFINRWPHYDLGDLAIGRVVDLEIIVANHSLIPAQVPTEIAVNVSGQLEADQLFNQPIPPQASGHIFRGVIRLAACRQGGAGRINIMVTCADRTTRLVVKYRSIFQPSNIARAEIARYPGGSRSAFAWRGDMDHYDTSTFQSVDGLTANLKLAARYRFPQTMYLSTRLTLDAAAADEFYTHFGVDRGQSQIPQFVAWLRGNVSFRHQLTYPFDGDKPYALELGNHGHLHYGTEAAAAPDNDWKMGARMGAGHYDWMSAKKSSLAEQRDNALEARRWCERHFGFAPRSWAMPDRTNDAFTPAAMEAAGCEVLSDSDVHSKHNVLLQPPPHHPGGTRAVELTKRYPGDPESIFHVAMIRYWIHRAHRRCIPIVFMCHQHMRQFSGHSCARFTEHILRYVLSRFNGDLHINTVYGIGIYWREVLSPTTRTVSIECKPDQVRVCNAGSIHLAAVPIDLTFQGGRRATVLIALPPNASFRVFTDGRIEQC